MVTVMHPTPYSYTDIAAVACH